jgi:hypothetical protein
VLLSGIRPSGCGSCIPAAIFGQSKLGATSDRVGVGCDFATGVDGGADPDSLDRCLGRTATIPPRSNTSASGTAMTECFATPHEDRRRAPCQFGSDLRDGEGKPGNCRFRRRHGRSTLLPPVSLGPEHLGRRILLFSYV